MTHRLTAEQEKRLENFLTPPRIAVVATIRRDGAPQVTPNWYRYAKGRLSFSTTKERAKYRNLDRDNRLAVCIYAEPSAHDYVALRGRADIREGETIWPETRAIVERYVPAGQVEEMMDRLRTESRVVVTIIPENVTFREV